MASAAQHWCCMTPIARQQLGPRYVSPLTKNRMISPVHERSSIRESQHWTRPFDCSRAARFGEKDWASVALEMVERVMVRMRMERRKFFREAMKISKLEKL
jgi:hypothetical protein